MYIYISTLFVSGYSLDTIIEANPNVFSSLVSGYINTTSNDHCLLTKYSVLGEQPHLVGTFFTIFHCEETGNITYYHHDLRRTSSIIPVPVGRCRIEYRVVSSVYMGNDVTVRLTSIDVTSGNCSGGISN